MGRRRKSLRMMAVVLAFALAQAYTQLWFSASASTTSPSFPPQQILARLTTKGNLPITVNGTSATSGYSIATDAIIETPANVNATVDLGPLGTLDIEPGTKIKLEFDGECNVPPVPDSSAPSEQLKKCSVKVTIFAGCVAARHKKGSYFQVVNEEQLLLKESDKNRKGAGFFPICGGGGAGAGAAGTGLSTLAKVAIAALIIGGGGVIWWAVDNNPSPSSP